MGGGSGRSGSAGGRQGGRQRLAASPTRAGGEPGTAMLRSFSWQKAGEIPHRGWSGVSCRGGVPHPPRDPPLGWVPEVGPKSGLGPTFWGSLFEFLCFRRFAPKIAENKEKSWLPLVGYRLSPTSNPQGGGVGVLTSPGPTF